MAEGPKLGLDKLKINCYDVISIMPSARTTPLYDPSSGAKLLTAEEAADYLNYHVVSIHRLVGTGSLKSHRRTGRSLLFQKEDLDRFRLTSDWAARKASMPKPQDPPEQPPSKLEAKVRLDFGLGSIFQEPLDAIKDFSWDHIPLIRAEIDHKYGNRPFSIEVKSPDGGLWSISYDPPTWLERTWKNLRGGKRKNK